MTPEIVGRRWRTSGRAGAEAHPVTLDSLEIGRRKECEGGDRLGLSCLHECVCVDNCVSRLDFCTSNSACVCEFKMLSVCHTR